MDRTGDKFACCIQEDSGRKRAFHKILKIKFSAALHIDCITNYAGVKPGDDHATPDALSC